jgi:hypothetical protein
MVSSAIRRVSVKARRSLQKADSPNPTFDVNLFLDAAGLGRKINKFQTTQGDAAKNVMYIEEGGVKLTVVNEGADKQLWRSLDRAIFWEQDASRGQSICMTTATTVAPTTMLFIEKN